MTVNLSLEKMSVEEKVYTMEMIWNDLCLKVSDVATPSWHKKVLDEREELIEKGKEKIIDWDVAKKNIRKAVL